MEVVASVVSLASSKRLTKVVAMNVGFSTIVTTVKMGKIVTSVQRVTSQTKTEQGALFVLRGDCRTTAIPEQNASSVLWDKSRP